MFKKIRRYLVLLCVFALATNNIVDLDSLLEEGSPESAAVNTLPESADSVYEEIEEKQPEGIHQGSVQNVVQQLSSEELDCTYREQCEELDDTSFERVASYIHTYQKLPPVYITKKEALQQGWLDECSDNSLEQKIIGGDYFGNYQGLLPRKEGRSYRECDIDSQGLEDRGTKRLVYSNDGLIFYTEDHYMTFTLLYSHWNNENLQIF